VGQKADHFFRVDSTQFSLCTEKTYNELIDVFKIDSMNGFKVFEELDRINSAFNSVFSLPHNAKFKSNVFQYKKDYDGFHPTQKPVALLEDLIKTYSNEQDVILDFTMGSGSTGVASLNTNRKFLGVEMNEKYFDIGVNRMQESTIKGEMK
jgi:site-specific DNA-methyltransferase (adenine-specific)